MIQAQSEEESNRNGDLYDDKLAIIKYLLKYGAEVNELVGPPLSNRPRTLLDIAILDGNTDVERVLRKYGAKTADELGLGSSSK